VAPRSGKIGETVAKLAAKMSIAGQNQELSTALEKCQAFVCHWLDNCLLTKLPTAGQPQARRTRNRIGSCAERF
jgi:hypothetical protein